MSPDTHNTTLRERRSVPRFSPNPATICRVQSGAGADPQPATIHNISSNGIKLVVQHAAEVGAPLLVMLVNKSVPLLERTVAVRVSRVVKQADGSYALGCEFQTQLTGHELLALAL
jgi:hypothetical protein